MRESVNAFDKDTGCSHICDSQTSWKLTYFCIQMVFFNTPLQRRIMTLICPIWKKTMWPYLHLRYAPDWKEKRVIGTRGMIATNRVFPKFKRIVNQLETEKILLIQQMMVKVIGVEEVNVNNACWREYYIKGYKIYRANHLTRWKEVSIFVSRWLRVNSYKVMEDDEGRYIKVKFTYEGTQEILTINIVYLEPDLQYLTGVIPKAIFWSDITFRKSNQSNTKFWKESSVYNLKKTLNDKENIITKRDISSLKYFRSIAFQISR